MFGEVMAIYIKSVLIIYRIGRISVKNGPIFNPKPPFESSAQALSAHKSMGLHLLEQVR